MITIRKLMSFSPATRWRKTVRLLETYERSEATDHAYLLALTRLVRDGDLPPSVVDAADRLCGVLARSEPGDPLLRAVNTLRNRLAAHLGVEPADWDLSQPAGYGAPTDDGSESAGSRAAGTGLSGVTLVLESLRSPFNLGSIVRSAAAFGVGRVIAVGCADVQSPRFLRSAMGAESMVDLVVVGSDSPIDGVSDGAHAAAGANAPFGAPVPAAPPVIALELGGVPAGRFVFPDSGVLLVGSEELGLSPALLERADERVTVPMPGRKQSLNVGVAVGIALAFWSAAVSARS